MESTSTLQEAEKIALDAKQLLPAPELTIVVPTFNEGNNVPILIDRLHKTLREYDWEVIFVDDNSPDGTADVVRDIGTVDHRVRCIRRINRRGLAGAFIEGALASQARFIAVIDGDLQHDETRLTEMLQRLRERDVDLVIASRYAEGGSSGSLSSWRLRISKWSTKLSRHLFGISVSDPMSGFFMIKRTLFEELTPLLRTQGFKVLLDIITVAKGKLRIAEITYSFRKREHGKSKFDTRIALDFLALIVDKLTAGLVSPRFLLYSIVGSIGLALHILVLNSLLKNQFTFAVAQSLSTLLVIACNFILNNALTYGDQCLTGKRFLIGLIRFEIICSIGLISNVGIASWVYGNGNIWWLAGLSGALMGAAWNYLISAAFVWRRR